MDKKLISHERMASLDKQINLLESKVIQQGDKAHVTVDEQLHLLAQLKDFELGKFLIQNGGLNGLWTQYLVDYPFKKEKYHDVSSLEKFFLTNAPTVLATQERYQYFLKENQEKVAEGAVLASIPCGVMGELLNLNFSAIKSLRFVGIDLDKEAIKTSKENCASLEKYFSFEIVEKDAWEIDCENEFDLISSNGLSIYEPSDTKITILFRLFYRALKPNGKLVTSFLTPPPKTGVKNEWNFSNINREHLRLQKIIFQDILNVKWQCFRSVDYMINMLENIGFNRVKIIFDKAKLFPAIVGYKK